MKNTANTETHLSVDEKIKQGYTPGAMEEGFASASGVRGLTAESGGRITHPESGDRPRQDGRVKNPADDENAGLADN